MTVPMSWKLKLRYLAEYSVFMLVVGTLRLMPLETASFAMGWLFRKIAPKGKRHQRALDNLKRVMPELDARQRIEIVMEMWDTLGRIVAEMVHIDHMAEQLDRINIEACRELTKDIINRGKGSITVSMHSGNWELIQATRMAHGLKPVALYQKVKNPYVDEFLRRRRRYFNPGGTWAKSHSTVRKLIPMLRQGGHLGMLVDQREDKGITVPFFGLQSLTHKTPALLAIKTGAPIVAERIIRHPGLKFTVESVEIEVSNTGDKQKDIRETTRRINVVFENWIREYPGQWMWSNRRWHEYARPVKQPDI